MELHAIERKVQNESLSGSELQVTRHSQLLMRSKSFTGHNEKRFYAGWPILPSFYNLHVIPIQTHVSNNCGMWRLYITTRKVLSLILRKDWQR